MLLLIAALLAAAVMSPWLLLRAGRRAFLAIALVPLAGTAWVAAQGAAVHDGETLVEVHPWVGSIGLDLAFAMGTLQWLMALIVLGIGALVLAYCAWYFDDDEPGVPRFAGVLVAFVASMLGLVLADDLLLLYVFWELTTVFSFLLIGHDSERRASRRAAIQALVVTTFGGLVLLVGAILVGRAAGTFRITEILADPPTGVAVTVGVHLLLVGAISKSALLPFHFWLPSAMAAPTPVSAYLHAASMVKAGVYLVALLAPAFAGVTGGARCSWCSASRRWSSAAYGRSASTTSSCCSPTAPSASSASSSSSSAPAPAARCSPGSPCCSRTRCSRPPCSSSSG